MNDLGKRINELMALTKCERPVAEYFVKECFKQSRIQTLGEIEKKLLELDNGGDKSPRYDSNGKDLWGKAYADREALFTQGYKEAQEDIEQILTSMK